MARQLPDRGPTPAWCSRLRAVSAVGLMDDLIELNALAKISGQVVAAGIVVANGVKFYWIPLPDRVVTLDSAASIRCWPCS